MLVPLIAAVRPIYETGDITQPGQGQNQQEFVRPRWPYDMRPSVRAEKYIRDASG